MLGGIWNEKGILCDSGTVPAAVSSITISASQCHCQCESKDGKAPKGTSQKTCHNKIVNCTSGRMSRDEIWKVHPLLFFAVLI